MKQQAKLTQETFTLLNELDIIEEGTVVYRFMRMACKKKITVLCDLRIDQKGFDTIEIPLGKKKIELTMPIFVKSKLELMTKKELTLFKKTENATFQILRRFYNQAKEERLIELVFDTQPESKR